MRITYLQDNLTFWGKGFTLTLTYLLILVRGGQVSQKTMTQREIKFRAWCEGTHGNMTFSEPHMEYDVAIVDGKYAGIEGGWDIQGTYESVPLMQFTGLTDKNGKEIYEGDVVDWYGGLQKTENENMGRGVCVGRKVVKFIDGSFKVFNNSYTRQYAEVVGDIYSNPELNN